METWVESEAEVARYGEYLLQELKWDTSRNYSSTKHMARLVGKKLDRKHSAIGTVIVSHSDLIGTPRYSYLGTYNFDIDAESNYDNLTLDTNLTLDSYTHALVPWSDINIYTIPVGATVSTKNGIDFVVAQQKSIKTWQQYWDTVNNSVESLKLFKAAGGWNNYKYLSVPVVQGVQREVVLGTSNGSGAQSFLVATLDIEAADSYYTKQFCYVEVQAPGDTEPVVWNEVYHLQTCQGTDRVFEINILDDLSGTEVKFGDGVFGAIPSKDAVITLHYLESKGADGIVSELYSFQNEINGAILPSETTYRGLTLGCQNVWPIIGGKNLEKLSEFKANAETAYMKNYKILHTFTELEDQINTISPVPLLKVRTATDYEITKVNSTNLYRNIIGISGLSMGLKPLNTTEQAVFESTLNSVINDNVLANKPIVYRSPNILNIDTAVEIELVNSILNKDALESEIEEYLQGKLGRTNFEALELYTQVQPIQNILTKFENIGSIQATNLFTIDCTDCSYGVIDGSGTYYFLFEFEFPAVESNVVGRNGYFERDLADGNEIYCIFNTNIAGTKNTLLIKETEKTGDSRLYFEKDSYFDDYLPVTLYNQQLNSRYFIYQTVSEKHCFTGAELQSMSKIQTKSVDGFKATYFFTDRSATRPKFYLMLDADTVATSLGFVEGVAYDIKRVYTSLKSSIDSDYTHITVSIEPADKTVTSDWNTIMFYDNISVSIE